MTDDPDWQAQMAQMNRYLEASREAPKATLEVLVEAMGASLGRSRGETDWSLTVACEAWKRRGGPMQRSRLLLRLKGPLEALKTWQSFMPGGACVRVQARLGGEAPFGPQQAWLERRRGPSEDAELLALKAELEAPVQIEDPLLGVLTLNRALDWYEGELSWCGQAVRLHASPESSDAPEAALAVARALLADAPQWKARVEDHAVQALLGLKNDSWLGDDEPPVDAAGFKARMRLTSIGAQEGGGFSFWHDDGGLFWGHSILVTGDLESGPTDADIPG